MTKPTNRIRALTARTSDSVRFSAYANGGDSSHMGASVMSRELGSWLPGMGSADADLEPDRPMLVSRSRDLARNHGIASGGFQTLRDNVVGVGPRLSAKPDYRALGQSFEWAREWSTVTEAKWRSYSETIEIDAAGQLNFGGLCTQVFSASMMNGEAIALPLWLPIEGSRYSTRFQVIEADRLGNPLGKMDSESLRGGIEIDSFGRPLAYHVAKAHPGDYLIGSLGRASEFERIPANTPWGRKRVIHVHDKERTGQTRGKPLLAPVLAQFKMLDHYQRTELQAAVVNAMIAAFVETSLSSQDLAELFGGDRDTYMKMRGEHRVQLKGGAIVPMFPGDKLTPFMPARPAATYGPFTETVFRHIGVALGLPLELLLKDFSKTNYSSARAALLEAWRFFQGRRQWLTFFWCLPVYELWLEDAVNAGEIEAPDFYENRYAYSRCRWIWPARGQIDPVKEAAAAEIRMQNGTTTLEIECAEFGLDWEEVADQRAAENRRFAELGLPAISSEKRPLPAEPEPAPEPVGTGAPQ